MNEATGTTTLELFRSGHPQRRTPLVHYFTRTLSAAAADACSDAVAAALQRRGVGRGDRVAMYMQNIPQALITVLAAWKCGAVVVPCNPMWRESELAAVLSDSGSEVLVCQDDLYRDVACAAVRSTDVHHVITTSPLDFLDEHAAVPAALAGVERCPAPGACDLIDLIWQHVHDRPAAVPITGADVAFMIYTSGTTGAPKGALNTHANVVAATSIYQRWIGLTSDDTILGLAPLFHVTGLVGHATLALLTGCPLVLFYRFNPAEVCRLAERYRASFTVSSVTAFIALLNDDALARHDLSSLTKVYTGGAPTPPRVLDEWRARTGTRIHPMYGLTETTSPAHMTPFGAIPPIDPATGVLSIGKPVFDTRVRIVTERGTDAAVGESGELVISGPQVVPGYWRIPADSAGLAGGELRTGDIGFADRDGWYYLVDRAKDLIIASGFKVWPREVEEVLYRHPAVREAAVVGAPDDYRGETVKAFVSLRPGHATSAADIIAFARTQMAAYKYPRRLEIVDELPKTASGKILRRALRTQGAAAPA